MFLQCIETIQTKEKGKQGKWCWMLMDVPLFVWDWKKGFH